MAEYSGDRELDGFLGEAFGECRHDWQQCGPNVWDSACSKCHKTGSTFAGHTLPAVGDDKPYSGTYEGMGTVLTEIGKRLFSVRRRFSLELQRLADEATNMSPCVHVAWPDALTAFPDKMPHFVARAAYAALTKS